MRINLNNLLDRLTRNPIPGCSPRVRRHDNPALETKSQRRRAVRDFDRARWVGVVVGHGAEPGLCARDGGEGEGEGELGWVAEGELVVEVVGGGFVVGRAAVLRY